MIFASHVARMEEGRNALKILTSKPTGKRSLWSPRRRWEDNTRTILGYGLLESPCECGIEPPGSISHGVIVIVKKIGRASCRERV